MPKGDERYRLSEVLINKYPDLKNYTIRTGRLNRGSKETIIEILNEEEKEKFIKIFFSSNINENYKLKLKEKGLNDEQIEFIVSPVEDSKLIGIPGGGKSTCIKEYAVDKYEKKLLKNDGILFLMFNKDAQESLFYKLKDFNIPDNLVRTFSSLILQICKINKIRINESKEIKTEDEVSRFHDGNKDKVICLHP
jgi:hypothetical protein